MATSTLARYPASRILAPLACGILAHPLTSCWWAPLLLIALSVVIYLLLAHRASSPAARLQLRPYFILPLALCAFSLGLLAAIIHDPPHMDHAHLNHRIITGRVSELEYTDFSMRLTIEVLDTSWSRSRVLVSTRGCNYTMIAGDLVAWPAALHEVSKLGNPDEMDYPAHLLHNEGIRYEQHLDVNKVKKIGHSPTLYTRLANVRRDLQAKVFNTTLTPAAQQFVVALLLGNKDFIDKATRQDFSTAGVAHILALSGLHIGIIALMIWWFLFPLDYIGKRSWRLFFTLAAIVLFAVFTGLSPSVVRATIMVGFVFASTIFYRRSVSLNALMMAAILILVFNPTAIYSVGFQLSFITVGAILLFARVPQSLESPYRLLNRLTSTAITSLVAMLATVALCAYYFHTVSLLSVIANLLILPILPVLMILAAIFMLVTAAGMQSQVLNELIDWAYDYIHWVAKAISSLPGSHFAGVYVSTFGVVAYFVILTLIVLWLYRRNYRYLLWAGGVLVAVLTHSLWMDARTPRQGLITLGSFNSTPILYYNNSRGYVWIPDIETPDSAGFARFYAGFLARHGIEELTFITAGDTLRHNGAMIKPPLAFLFGKRILAAGSGKWKRMAASRRLPVDAVVITRRYRGTMSRLLDLYEFKRVVISSAHQESARLRMESDSLGLEVAVGSIDL